MTVELPGGRGGTASGGSSGRSRGPSSGSRPARHLGSVPAGEHSAAASEAALWHLRVTFAGAVTDVAHLVAGLRVLVEAQPLATVRYAADRAEISYWDEAEDIDDVAALGLRLWAEHRRTADLPDWQPVGLEVLDRGTFHARGQRVPSPSSAGDVRPF